MSVPAGEGCPLEGQVPNCLRPHTNTTKAGILLCINKSHHYQRLKASFGHLGLHMTLSCCVYVVCILKSPLISSDLLLLKWFQWCMWSYTTGISANMSILSSCYEIVDLKLHIRNGGFFVFWTTAPEGMLEFHQSSGHYSPENTKVSSPPCIIPWKSVLFFTRT